MLVSAMADASVSLGLDASEFASGLANAEQGNERLFTSAHRTAGRIGHLSDELYKGGQAGGFIGQALIAAEQSLNLPLSSLAIFAGLG